LRTHADREKHEQYHCGNEENAYRNNSDEGKIGSRTPYGFGIPNNDRRLFNDMALFGVNTQQWKCLLCGYKRDKYQRYQVFGHIASTHGYISRVPNERWGILLNEKYNDPSWQQQPINLKKTQIADIQNERVRIKQKDGKNCWECGYCERTFGIENEKGITTQIGRMHGEIKITNLRSP